MTTVLPPRARGRTTRWHATATTLRPSAKVAITTALVLPVVVCAVGLAAAGSHVQNAFLVVPLWLFGVVAAVVLHAVWERG